MELQGNKAVTHDFLSIRKDSSLSDERAPPQGCVLSANEFLPPLERLEKNGNGYGGGGATTAGEAPTAAIDLNVAAAPAAAAEVPGSTEHVRPRCLGAHGFGRVRGGYQGNTTTPVPVAVKTEWPTCGAPPWPGASAPETKADTEGFAVAGVGAATSHGAGRKNPYNPAGLCRGEPPYIPGERAAVTSRGPRQCHPQRQQPQWPSPIPFPAARGGSNAGFLPFSPAGRRSGRDKRRPMDAVPKSNTVFADEEEEEEEEEDFGKSETSSHKGLTVKVDGGSSNNDQKPSTPRSKHSATEQRRRSKINDRFQILRSLIPHSDQKRDKASFLLEVIEYIQFLQEKVQKYESSYPGWNHDHVKLMPWKNSEAPGESMVDPSNIMKNGHLSSGLSFPVDSAIGSAPTVMLNSQNMAESENISCGLATKSASMPIPMQYPPGGASSGFFQPQQRLITDSENMVVQPQAHWQRSCTTDCSVSTDILGGQDDLVIDEGTISLSSVYSDGLLNTLTHAVQSSGIDLSQANISVQINLGKRAISRPIPSTKDKDDPSSSNQLAGHSRVGSSGEESELANKRHKSDTT